MRAEYHVKSAACPDASQAAGTRPTANRKWNPTCSDAVSGQSVGPLYDHWFRKLSHARQPAPAERYVITALLRSDVGRPPMCGLPPARSRHAGSCFSSRTPHTRPRSSSRAHMPAIPMDPVFRVVPADLTPLSSIAPSAASGVGIPGSPIAGGIPSGFIPHRLAGGKSSLRDFFPTAAQGVFVALSFSSAQTPFQDEPGNRFGHNLLWNPGPRPPECRSARPGDGVLGHGCA